MFIYQLPQGGLLIINPMVVSDKVLQQILDLGYPRICTSAGSSSNSIQSKDVAAWKLRFPDCPYACAKKEFDNLKDSIPLQSNFDGTIESILHYSGVETFVLPDNSDDVCFLLTVEDNTVDKNTNQNLSSSSSLPSSSSSSSSSSSNSSSSNSISNSISNSSSSSSSLNSSSHPIFPSKSPLNPKKVLIIGD
eukprot:MONOS_15934.1-p1 / transcript=MONOS_15934.1 / gene=MONOS_15934 / organism=Monocercomonoides_exilis_PA203 / gene_product=unspecified product / transcript_product=unspecified product / location=Mono_scaffold01417:155-1046(-) / protein_length=191 / sequence_SO=supercontig / SO=protein_coding / is_pseudo=false